MVCTKAQPKVYYVTTLFNQTSPAVGSAWSFADRIVQSTRRGGGGGAVTLIKKNYLDLGCLSRGFLCIVICCVVSVPAACAVQESQSDRATNDTDG